ncbi:MAG TPA: sugar ABC transporter substrate-binding protein [Propioniciclava tarda]|nr:sugar ABC transporter substrate-binding protein [Propioniciclava tarda]
MVHSSKRKLALVSAMTAFGLTLTACGGGTATTTAPATGGSSSSSQAAPAASGEVNYWLWDANQLPAYQTCADDFHKANPNVTVKVTQYGWDDYWAKVTNGFVAGTAPDVFTNHLSKYPEFVTNSQLEPLDSYISADGVKTDIYQPGLADLWVAQDGKRYGLPKDFDTVAIFYNDKLVQDAGLTGDALGKLTWNYDDGGTYEKAIAHLTIDTNGKRGDEAGFDKTKVKVYGLGLDGGSGGGNGQTQWSMYSGTTGWQFTDKATWGTKYNYNDPKFQKTIAWMRHLIDKGYMPSLEAVTGQSSADIFAAGKYAMITQGSWMIGQFYGYKDIKVGLAPTPTGPEGKRASMYNGLADSIWAGSKNKAAAAKWVEYLGSPACQNVVGAKGVVFPAIPSGTQAAQDAFKAKGIDVSAFLVHTTEKTTFLFPITDHASQINPIMQAAVDSVFTGKADAASLTAANDQVNALFGK